MSDHCPCCGFKLVGTPTVEKLQAELAARADQAQHYLDEFQGTCADLSLQLRVAECERNAAITALAKTEEKLRAVEAERDRIERIFRDFWKAACLWRADYRKRTGTEAFFKVQVHFPDLDETLSVAMDVVFAALAPAEEKKP